MNLSDPLGLWGIGWGDGNGNVSGNIGVGSPWLLFTPDSGMDVSMAAAATLDGIIPFADPYADMGAYDPCDESFAFSRSAGEFARNAYLGGRFLKGYRQGKEFPFGKNRVAPWGNRTGHPTGKYPHYHRPVPNPKKPGDSLPGQGKGRHRPWDTKPSDKSFRDRF